MEDLEQRNESITELVNRIAGHLQRGGGFISQGDVAELCRMDPRKPAAPFFKLSGLLLDELLPGEVRARERLETLWATIVVGLAHLGELHRPKERLGFALANAEFSELRFTRLLRADEERLVDDLPSLARFLSAKRIVADWSDAAKLVLASNELAERIRRNLSRDYFRGLSIQNQRTV